MDIEYEQCLIFNKQRFSKNATRIFHIEGYEGVPEMLLINIVATLILILIFSILRKKAWHYGRLALLHRKRSTTCKLYFGYDVFTRIMLSVKNIVKADGSKKSLINDKEKKDKGEKSRSPSLDGSLESHVISGGSSGGQSSGSSPPSSAKSSDKTRKEKRKFLSDDHGIFGWIRVTLNLNDDHIADKCGVDSVYYAMFQRRLIAYMLVISILGVGILLPIHMTGHTITEHSLYFAKTSIANVPSGDLYWAHCGVLLMFNLICIFFLRNFSARLPTKKEELLMSSIMIRGIDKLILGKSGLIRRYFDAAYPEYNVTNVKFAYDVRKLMACQVKLKNAVGALKAAQKEYKKNPMMNVTRWSKAKIPCTEYYENQVEQYRKQLLELKEIAEKTPLPICFVTFADISQTLLVVKDFKRTRCGPLILVERTVSKTKYDERVKPDRWTVTTAPDPDDIEWENLSVRHWYFRTLFINVAAFLLAFFFTTPAFVVMAIVDLSDVLNIKWESFGFVIQEGLPVILLITFASLLPYLLSYAEYHCCHRTKSYENLMVIRKVTIFLFFMVLILPSISFSSARHFAEMFFNPSDNSTKKWGCIYLPQNGAFYTNYVISSTWVSVALEFLRLGGLINYGVRRLFARSKFERFHATWATVWAFPFGDNYAWMLLIFSIVIVYGVFFPLILPAGFLYFLFKYYADRYNMFFAYIPGKISKEQHLAAMNFILFSFLLSQFVLALYLTLTIGLKNFMTLFMIITFMFSTVGFIWHSMYGWIWYGASGNKPVVFGVNTSPNTSVERQAAASLD